MDKKRAFNTLSRVDEWFKETTRINGILFGLKEPITGVRSSAETVILVNALEKLTQVVAEMAIEMERFHA